MPTHAATALHHAATHTASPVEAANTVTRLATAVLIAAVIAALYLLTCLIWPFGKCRRCKGGGKFTAPSGKAFRHCRKCKGTGHRVRPGRHVINRIRDTRRAGTR
ncbi:MAG TPA: hypothetical protein VIP77_16620 [Jiangellaceae bacterium]